MQSETILRESIVLPSLHCPSAMDGLQNRDAEWSV